MFKPLTPDQPLSVTQLTLQIKESLEASFPSVWVAGELSNVARPQSGHVYLTLKDEGAQLRGVMWRSAASRLKFELQDGQEVACRGDIDVYPPRGAYQLIIRQIEPLGEGALQLALRQLQQRLEAEGLFDPRHKKPLPRFPRRIAFVTSPTGAAIRDFLEVLRRRWRGVHVLVIPAKVQGEGAAAEIVRGIQAANALGEPPDVLVVGRGGGSLEDLWCFNEEPVVRAIFASQVPVVSAVGHEIDVTLSDLVADVRALTPSEAAELVVPSEEDIRAGLDNASQRLTSALKSRASDARSRLTAIAEHRVFRRPFERVHDLSRQLDDQEMRAVRALRYIVSRSRDHLHGLAGRLESLSPLAVLNRGYSVTQKADDGEVITDAGILSVGDSINSRLAHGHVISRVEQVHVNGGKTPGSPQARVRF
ncbi:MAG: exodeoxyribonuclease VII large subunit [Planctomycetes bacterium]|nr:exodeoxyribonuclease VII large subunit [Planctomycetota bacterium]MBL7040412.1 exodeoxyribonuclease VII large subunit [Pirellulaceae bacterium]